MVSGKYQQISGQGINNRQSRRKATPALTIRLCRTRGSWWQHLHREGLTRL